MAPEPQGYSMKCILLSFMLCLHGSLSLPSRGYRKLGVTIDCDFDSSFCLFNNSCLHHWTRLSGSTPSVGTGPSSDHTSGSGYYAYIEASYPNYPFKGPFCLDMAFDVGISNAVFYYHMFGSDIGTLNLQSSNDGSSWSTVWTKTGEQGDSWQFANTSISDSSNALYMRFEATTGVYFDGDIAIDDVSFTEMATFAPTITPAPSATFRPTSLPTKQPTSSPTTEAITSEYQLNTAVATSGTVDIAADIYLDFSIYMVGVELVLNGHGYKVDGQNAVRCLVVIESLVTINNLTITHGFSADGGGFLATSGTVYFYGCVIRENSAPSGDASLGGGVRSSASTLYLIDTLVSNNYSPQGGGVAFTDGGVGVLLNSTIRGNIADDSGAGVYVEETNLRMVNCTLTENEVRAGSGGGLFMTYDADVNVSYCNISSNVAAVGGGGVLVDSAHDVLFDHTLVDSNRAYLGGGILLSSSVASLVTDYCAITNNVVDGWSGGGIYVTDGIIRKNNGVIANNSALGVNFQVTGGNCTSVGGCFYSPMYPADYVVDETCTIEVLKNGSLDVVSFSTESGYDFLTINSEKYSGIIGPDCEYVNVGDKITFNSDSYVVSGGFEVCHLKTPNGGGMSLNGGNAYFTNVDVYGNAADRYGGGLHIEGGNMNVDSSNFYHNKANALGGAISFVSGAFNAIDMSLEGLLEGVSANAATCTSSCAKGEYANCTMATADCFVNCVCSKCPAGTASSILHASTTTVCTQCSAGTYASSAGSISCETCSKGKYATDDASEDSGGLDYQVAIGATICNECPAGLFQASAGSIVCDHCDGGTYSGQGSSNCSICKAGTRSHRGDWECTQCEVGRYNQVDGSERCELCPDGYSSDEGATICDDSAIGYYLGYVNQSWQSVLCPRHATCFGSDYLPIPKANYWVDRTNLKYGGEIIPCVRSTCKGASIVNISCWSFDNYNFTRDPNCHNSELQCATGAYGPLCGSCKEGFTYTATSKSCIHCRDMLTYTFIVIGIFVGLVLLTGLIYWKYHLIPKSWKKNTCASISKQLIKEDDTLRVLFSTFQIIQSVSWTTNTVLPDPFNSFLDKGSFISFDFFKVDCLLYGSDLFTSVYVWSLTPICIAVLNYIVFKIRVFCLSSANQMKKVVTRRKLLRSHLFYFLTLTYLVLPVVTRVQFQALDCIHISNHYYVRSDTSINCASDEFRHFVILDAHFIFTYLSVPFLWVYLLYRKIDRINPQFGDVEEILRYRMIDPGLRPIKFLFDAYKPKYWYFESIELLRRIAFIGIIPLISSKSPRRAALGLFLAIASSVVYREMEPFRRPATNFLMQIANGAIVTTFGVALAINTELTNGLDMVGIGVVLILINFGVFVVAVALSMGFFYNKEKSQLLIHRKLNTKEIEGLFNFINLNARTASSSPTLRPWSELSQKKKQELGNTPPGDNQDKELLGYNEEEESINLNNLNESQRKVAEQKKAIINKVDKCRLNEKDVTILQVIGNGGFGLVCFGKYKSKPVAVKILSDVTDFDQASSFRNEINKIMNLPSHRNVVAFHGICYGIRCVPCCLFEYMSNHTLASMLNNASNNKSNNGGGGGISESLFNQLQKDSDMEEGNSGRQSLTHSPIARPIIASSHISLKWEDPLLKWTMDIARGMQFLHDHNISMEKGLTPQHILINGLHIAKIDCFGMKHDENKRQGKVQWGGKSAPMSKLAPYVAPEVMRSEQENGKLQDIYSFGMCVLTMSLDVSLESYLCHQWSVGGTPSTVDASSNSIRTSNMLHHAPPPPSSSKEATSGSSGLGLGQHQDSRNSLTDISSTVRESQIEDVESALQAIWKGKWHPIEDVSGFPSAPKTICDIIVLCCDHVYQNRPSFEKIMKTLVRETVLEVEAISYTRGRGSSFYSAASSKSSVSSITSSPFLLSANAEGFAPPPPPSDTSPRSPLTPHSPYISSSKKSISQDSNQSDGESSSNKDLSPRLQQRKSENQRLALYRRISGKQNTFIGGGAAATRLSSSSGGSPQVRSSQSNQQQEIELSETTEI